MRAKVTVDLKALGENINVVQGVCESRGVTFSAVTKMHCADPAISRFLVGQGIKILSDSRIDNLRSLSDLECEKWLLRIPGPSISEEVVTYSDLALTSEVEQVKALDHYSAKLGKRYKILLMVDLGDLREGYFTYESLRQAAVDIKKFKNIDIEGLGTNLSCYGGVNPSVENMSRLISFSNDLYRDEGIKSHVISGGGSSTYGLYLDDSMPKGINSVRLGDTLYLGRDRLRLKPIEGMHDDVFVLTAEVVEIKEKPSVPIGEIGLAALNTVPTFVDKGIRKRAILSVGRQDVDLDLTPFDREIELLGASSDHLLIDISDSTVPYKVGDFIRFKMGYTASMRAFTSKYIDKEYVNA
jgi:predicted amino acid racemase